MMTDKMIDEALVELARTMKALQALRTMRKADRMALAYLHENVDSTRPMPEHAAANRATLDLTRKLAQLRRGD